MLLSKVSNVFKNLHKSPVENILKYRSFYTSNIFDPHNSYNYYNKTSQFLTFKRYKKGPITYTIRRPVPTDSGTYKMIKDYIPSKVIPMHDTKNLANNIEASNKESFMNSKKGHKSSTNQGEFKNADNTTSKNVIDPTSRTKIDDSSSNTNPDSNFMVKKLKTMYNVIKDESFYPKNTPQMTFLTGINYKKKYGDLKSNARIGTVGIKLGNTSFFLKSIGGEPTVVTAIQLQGNQVVDRKFFYDRNDGSSRNKIFIAGGIVTEERRKYLSDEVKTYYEALGIEPRSVLMGFNVKEEFVLPVGSKIDATYYRPGLHVNVRGISKDTGVMGVIARWGFKGMPKTHGVTRSHRKPGYIGGRKGLVLPGKKMAGHAGLKKIMEINLKILRINYKYNVIFVKGSIPGYIGAPVIIRDAFLPPGKIIEYMNSFPHDSDDVIDDDVLAFDTVLSPDYFKKMKDL